MQRTSDARIRYWGIALVLVLLVIDQALKFWVKTHMTIGEEIFLLGNWCRLYFVENSGIAFGLKPDSVWLKVLLSVLRIVAVAVLCYLAHYVSKSKAPRGIYFALLGLIAGALGNVIDGTFYGVLFSSSDTVRFADGEMLPALATFLPAEGGYAPLLQGKVVDMFYFPLFDFYWPSWFPFIGGQHFEFFKPIFNFADALITVSVFYAFLFHGKYLWRISTQQKARINAK